MRGFRRLFSCLFLAWLADAEDWINTGWGFPLRDHVVKNE